MDIEGFLVLKNFGFTLYLIFITSWFLHITSRISFFGLIRLDLLLVLILTVLIVLHNREKQQKTNYNEAEKILRILIIWIIIATPFAQWPGSVIHAGIPNFIKAIVFYYFTVHFVTTGKKFKIFIGIFLACQSLRIIEPIYLHVTTGYWGSAAYASGVIMDRLSGAPHDIVNPNGLAFIIDTVIPFFFFLSAISWKNKIISLIAIPIFIYALILTSSRSGLIGLGVILIGIIWKSNKKLMVTSIIILSSLFVFNNLSLDQQDRYLSIVSKNTKNSATAEGRIAGIEKCFRIALRRPIFGHGLGTSYEANVNFGGSAQFAHNLYAEVVLELGFVGLVIYLCLLKSIISNFLVSYKIFSRKLKEDKFLVKITDAAQVWLAMCLLFSFATYGLSTYVWYLFLGISVVLMNIIAQGQE